MNCIMKLDINIMKAIVEEMHEAAIVRLYGNPGVTAFRDLLESIKSLYEFINPETTKSTLIIIREISSTGSLSILGIPTHFNEVQYLAAHCDTARDIGTTVIQVISPSEYRVWKNVSIKPAKLANQAIVYLLSEGKEFFLIESKRFEIKNPSHGLHSSIFAIPTFRYLADALEDYKWRSIRTSRCQIFSNAWHGGESSNKLFFECKPEVLMRKSLAHYLHDVIRDGNVHPETNVDETHPVDIQVTWQLTNRIAIIEIKWMGNSLSESGSMVKYRDARAKKGAKQLAEYLDAKRKWAPGFEVYGYLVIIDARRKGVKPTSEMINSINGLWYKDQNIKFNPEYHKTRFDFFEPIRMFAEPLCSPD